MADIKIVIFLIRCSQSLLHCDDINTEQLSFVDMPACVAEIPILIKTAKRASLTNHVFMGRCHYLTKSPQRKTRDVAAGESTPAPVELSVALRRGVP